MLQELFRIPGLDIPIYGYGVMLVVGFLAAAHLAKYLANRCGLDGEFFINAALIGLVAGIIGARLSHILENLEDFTRPHLGLWGNFKNMISLQSGGLTYYGGFLLAAPILIFYAVRSKMPLRLGMDIIAPCLMVGLGFGRVGCFLNGCCYGAPCDLPWAVQFPYQSPAYTDDLKEGNITLPPELRTAPNKPDSGPLPYREAAADPTLRSLVREQWSNPVHPAQLYSTITAFFLAGLLLAYFTLPHAPGRVFALMMMLEGATRFILELLRVEPREYFGLSLSMVISLGLLSAGIALWFLLGRLALPAPSHELAHPTPRPGIAAG